MLLIPFETNHFIVIYWFISSLCWVAGNFVQRLQNSSRKIFLIIKQQGRNTFLNSHSIVAPSKSLKIIFCFKRCYLRHSGLSRALGRLHFKQNSWNLHQRPCQCDRRDIHQKTWLSLAEGRTWSRWISLHLSPELCTWKKLFYNFIVQNGNHL